MTSRIKRAAASLPATGAVLEQASLTAEGGAVRALGAALAEGCSDSADLVRAVAELTQIVDRAARAWKNEAAKAVGGAVGTDLTD